MFRQVSNSVMGFAGLIRKSTLIGTGLRCTYPSNHWEAIVNEPVNITKKLLENPELRGT